MASCFLQWLQSIYWCVAVAAGLSTLSYENGGRKGVLHRLFDTIHTSLAFPVGIVSKHVGGMQSKAQSDD